MIRYVALLAALTLCGAAQAQSRPLTDSEVLDLAAREAVWCENWSDETRDCETLYTLRQEADGALISAGMFILTLNPLIEVVIADRVTLQDGRLCSSGSTDELNIVASRDGRPSVEASMMVRLIMAESMAEYADTIICQQLLATGDPEYVGEIITADEERLYDFESTYRLGTFGSGFLLRPVIGEATDEGQTQL
jgi:hypothetical protein